MRTMTSQSLPIFETLTAEIRQILEAPDVGGGPFTTHLVMVRACALARDPRYKLIDGFDPVAWAASEVMCTCDV